MTIVLFVLLLLSLGALGAVSFFFIQASSSLTKASKALVACQQQRQSESAQLGQAFADEKAKYTSLYEKVKSQSAEWATTRKRMEDEIKELSPYRGIKDLEKTVRIKLRQSEEKLLAATRQAEEILHNAKAKHIAYEVAAQKELEAWVKANKARAEAELAAMQVKIKQAQSDLETSIAAATGEASRIIEAAHRKAESIAGEAYHIAKNASLYEKTVKAMKNLIEGYGNEYIIPEQSLLDDLAEDFSHTEAGQRLKVARDKTKVMIRNGAAASCDYVEATRKETATNFVLDAFNGKVDSILSRVKQDNAGKLAQSIRDAFTLVNFNGKAFKDARINEEFLEARLDELKWAEIAQQLSAKERDEQRVAKEKIREEARAVKEQQQALQRAAKEEAMLEKALMQAKLQFEEATDEQREMYEQRLKDMEFRLKEAVERKERAKSMAEQTRKGYVYIISNVGSFGENIYKIGLTRRDDPFDRVRELGDASVPFGFDVHAMILGDDAPSLENQLHRHFLLRQINKVNHRKEFFRVTLGEIKSEIDGLNLTTGVKWTMTSEAAEYRETLAIESAIATDPNQRELWIKRQLMLEPVEDVESIIDTEIK